MAAFDITGQAATLGIPEYSLNGNFSLPIKIDFAKVNGGTVVASGDLVTFWKAPKEVLITQMVIKTEKVEGGTLTVDVGDTDDTNGWFDNFDGDTLASQISTLITAGEYYSTAALGVFIIVPNNDADLAIVTVTVIGVNAGFRLTPVL